MKLANASFLLGMVYMYSFKHIIYHVHTSTLIELRIHTQKPEEKFYMHILISYHANSVLAVLAYLQ